jgi:hypothetical protein
MRELTEHDKQLLIDSIPESNLVLFCPGLQGRGATLLDRSQYANHGTISGATWKREPRGLLALSYDGVTNYTNFGNAVSLRVIHACTIMLWVKHLGGNSSSNNANVFGRSNLRLYNPTLTTPTILNWYIDAVGGAQFLSAGSITVGEWTLIGMTYDDSLGSNHGKIFQDGVKISQGNCAGGLTAPTATWYEGGNISGQTNVVIALRRIFDRALSEPEMLRFNTREHSLLGV